MITTAASTATRPAVRVGDLVDVPAGSVPEYKGAFRMRVTEIITWAGKRTNLLDRPIVGGIVVNKDGADRMRNGTPVDRSVTVPTLDHLAVITPAPATSAEIHAARVEDDTRTSDTRCAHVTGEMGCDLVKCNGIPPVDVAALQLRVPSDAPDPRECGSDGFTRQLRDAFRARGLSAEMTGDGDNGWDRAPARIREVQVSTFDVNGHAVCLVAYESRGPLTPVRTHYALIIDGSVACGTVGGGMSYGASLVNLVAYNVARCTEIPLPAAPVADVSADTDADDPPMTTDGRMCRWSTVAAGEGFSDLRGHLVTITRVVRTDQHITTDESTGDYAARIDYTPVIESDTGEVTEVRVNGPHRLKITLFVDNGPDTYGTVTNVIVDERHTVFGVTLAGRLPGDVLDCGCPAANVALAGALGHRNGCPSHIELSADQTTEPNGDHTMTTPTATADQTTESTPADASPLAAVVDRAALVRALDTAHWVIGTRSNLPLLAHVKITTGGSGVTLEAFDYEASARFEVPGSASGNAVVLVRAAAMRDMVRQFPAPAKPRKGAVATPDTVSLSCAGGTLRIAYGDMGADLATYPTPDDYPTLPATPPTVATLPAGMFAATVARAAVAAGKDATLPVLTGVHVTVSADNPGMLRMETTDRYRLARDQVAATGTSGTVDALVPAPFLVYAAKLAGKLAGDVHIGADDTRGVDGPRVSVTVGGVTLATRTLDGTFPKLDALIGGDRPYTVTVDAAALADTVKRVSPALERSTPVRLEFDPSGVNVVAISDGDRAASHVPCAHDVPADTRIGFNHAYLTAGLRTFTGDVRIGVNTPRMPVLITQDGLTTQHVLMPVRLDDTAPVKTPVAAPAAPADNPAPDSAAAYCAPDMCTHDHPATGETDTPAVTVRNGEDARTAMASGDAAAIEGRNGNGERLTLTARITRIEPITRGRMAGSVRAKLSTGRVIYLPVPAPVAAPAVSDEPSKETAMPAPAATAPATVEAPAPIDAVERLAEDARTLMSAGDYAAARVSLAGAEDAAPAGYLVAGRFTFDQVRAMIASHESANAPAPVAAEDEPAVTAAAPVATDAPADIAARVREVLSAGSWSIDTVTVKGKRFPADVLTLPKGRLSRDEYVAIRDQVSTFGGVWNKGAKGFIFETSHAEFTGGYSASGRDRLAAWLAGDQVAAPVVDTAPVVDQVPTVDTPAPVVDQVPAPAPAPVTVAVPVMPADVAALTDAQRAEMAATFAAAYALLTGDQATPAPVPAAPVAAPETAATRSSDTFTLPAYALTGMSYGDARNAVRAALKGAGVKGASVEKGTAKRDMIVTVRGDRAAALATVRAAMRNMVPAGKRDAATVDALGDA
jgi:DNA polymerase-3 subunit beta